MHDYTLEEVCCRYLFQLNGIVVCIGLGSGWPLFFTGSVPLSWFFIFNFPWPSLTDSVGCIFFRSIKPQRDWPGAKTLAKSSLGQTWWAEGPRLTPCPPVLAHKRQKNRNSNSSSENKQYRKQTATTQIRDIGLAAEAIHFMRPIQKKFQTIQTRACFLSVGKVAGSGEQCNPTRPVMSRWTYVNALSWILTGLMTLVGRRVRVSPSPAWGTARAEACLAAESTVPISSSRAGRVGKKRPRAVSCGACRVSVRLSLSSFCCCSSHRFKIHSDPLSTGQTSM